MSFLLSGGRTGDLCRFSLVCSVVLKFFLMSISVLVFVSVFHFVFELVYYALPFLSSSQF